MSTPALLFLMLAGGIIGLRIQSYPGSERARHWLWNANYIVLIPAASAYAFLTVKAGVELVAVVACGIVAWWLTVAGSWVVARTASTSRAETGALTLIGAFPNTGFIGFPLANLAFGPDGLRLAIIYDQVSLIVPAIVVATVIAQRHSTGESGTAPASIAGLIVRSPPVWTVLVFASIRIFVLEQPAQLDWLGTLIGAIIAPVGFLLLGLSLPLHGFSHKRAEVLRVVLASCVRVLVAPVLLWLVGTAASTAIPPAMYLIAAMPTAFHTLVISRLHDLEPALVRLGVLVTTIVVVSATMIGTLMAHAG